MKPEEAIVQLKKLRDVNKRNSIGKAIETVLQELKRSQKENESKEKAYNDCYCEYKHYKQFESVPKKKIEDKIELLKAQCGGNVFHIQQTLNAEIRLLQELLEDK